MINQLELSSHLSYVPYDTLATALAEGVYQGGTPEIGSGLRIDRETQGTTIVYFAGQLTQDNHQQLTEIGTRTLRGHVTAFIDLLGGVNKADELDVSIDLVAVMLAKNIQNRRALSISGTMNDKGIK